MGFLVDSPFGQNVDEACKSAVIEFLKEFEPTGVEVVDIKPDFGDVESFSTSFQVVWSAMVAQGKEPDKLFGNHMIDQAKGYSAKQLAEAQFNLQKMSRALVAYWNKVDFLITPTLAEQPLEAGAMLSLADKEPGSLFDRALQFTPFTPWFNVTGQPAISLPLHISNALPIGVQIVAGPWQDLKLLQFARYIEESWGYPDSAGNRHQVAPLAPDFDV